jgi:hypothetical protein
MAEYRIHFKNHGDHYFATEYFHSDNDENAISAAHRLHVPFIGRGFEVWQGDRLVHAHPDSPGH